MDTQKWLYIASLLQDGKNDIQCPFCKNNQLNIQKVKWPKGLKMDVYVNCPFCEAHTTFKGVDL